VRGVASRAAAGGGSVARRFGPCSSYRLAGLRAPLAGPMAERQRQAKEAVKRMLTLASQPPKKS
jgi:hypothetical protein